MCLDTECLWETLLAFLRSGGGVKARPGTVAWVRLNLLLSCYRGLNRLRFRLFGVR